MEKNNAVQINEGEWYEFVLDNDEKYVGKCTRRSFLVEIEKVREVGFSCREEDEKGDFLDLSISLQNIKSIKPLVIQKMIGDKIFEIIPYTENNRIKFDVVYYNEVDINEIKKEAISRKKRVGTFDKIKEAVDFLKKQT